MNLTAEILAQAMFEAERQQHDDQMQWVELYRPFKKKRVEKAASIIAALERITKSSI